MPLSDNLISYWKFDEASGNLLDAHGSNTGVEQNTVGTAAGKISTARDFEYDNATYFSTASNSSLNVGLGDFTWSIWTKLENPAVFVGNNILNKYTFGVYYFNPGGGVGVHVGGVNYESNDTTLEDNQWHHLAIIRAGTNVKVYQDNDLILDVDIGTVDLDHTSEFCFGSTSGGGQFWDGLLDECAFFKRALSAAEVADLFNSGAGRTYEYIVAPEVPSVLGDPLVIGGADSYIGYSYIGAGLSTAVQLSGTITGGGVAAGGLTVTKRLSGAPDGAGVASGLFDRVQRLSGAGNGAGVASGLFDRVQRLTGSAAGNGVASGSVSLTKQLAGVVDGAGVASGAMSLTKLLAGTAAGAASLAALAIGTETIQGVGGSGLTITLSNFTVTNAKAIYVAVGNRNQGNVSTVKWGAVDLVLVARSGGVTGSKTETWVLLNPTPGTADIVATFASSQLNSVIGAVGLTNTAGHRSAVHGTFAGSDVSLDAPSAAGDLVIDALNAWFQTPTMNSGQTQILSQSGTNALQQLWVSSKPGASPTVNMGWGNPGGSANLTAAAVSFAPLPFGLTVTKPLAGSVTGAGVASGSLRLGNEINLSGAANGAGTSGGGLTLTKTLSGAPDGSGSAAGGFNVTYRLAGSITGAAVVTGNATVRYQLSGTASGAGSASASISLIKRLQGVITGAGVSQGGLALRKPLAGTILGSGVFSGNLSLTKFLAGVITGTGFADGSLNTGTVALSGTAAGAGSATGTLYLLKSLAGSITGAGVASGVMLLLKPLAGTSAGAGVASGSVRHVVPLSGTSSGAGQAVGGIALAKRLAGVALGVGNVTGTLHLSKLLAGSVTGASNVTGDLTLKQLLAGSAAGVALVDGTLYIVKPLTGLAEGHGSITGQLTVGGNIDLLPGDNTVVILNNGTAYVLIPYDGSTGVYAPAAVSVKIPFDGSTDVE